MTATARTITNSRLVDGEKIDNLPNDTNAELAGKQDTLVSGTNIKTINGESILGPGNIVAGFGTGTVTSVTSVDGRTSIANPTTTPIITVLSAPIADTVTTNANMTGAIVSVGNATSLGSFTSAQLAAALTDETGTGSAVFSNSPILVSPALGTIASGVATNLTGTATALSIGGNAATATLATTFAWGASTTGTTGTGLTLAMGASYASGGIAQSITINNTQTNALAGLKISTGTSALGHGGLIIDSDLGGSFTEKAGLLINSKATATQAVFTGASVRIGDNFNTNSTVNHNHVSVKNEQNAGTGRNTGIQVDNYSTDFVSGFGSGARISQFGTDGTALSVRGETNVNSSTNGLVNYTLDNTQSGSSVIQKTDSGTSAQAHIHHLINLFNASTGARGVKIDGSTSGTGIGLEITGFAAVSTNFRPRIKFGTATIWESNGTTANGALSGTAGDFLINGPSSAPEYCTGTTNWTTLGAGGGGLSWGASISSGTGTGIAMATADLGGDKPFITMGHTASGTLTSNTTTQFSQTSSRTATGGTASDNFVNAMFSRTNITNGANLTSAGSVVNITGTDTQTANTLTPTYDLLKLDPSTRSTGSSIRLTVPDSTVAPTNGHIYTILGNTQTVAHIAQKIDLGTSAQMHTGLLINAKGNSSDQTGIIIDGGSNPATGITILSSNVSRQRGAIQCGVVGLTTFGLPLASSSNSCAIGVYGTNAIRVQFYTSMNGATYGSYGLSGNSRAISAMTNNNDNANMPNGFIIGGKYVGGNMINAYQTVGSTASTTSSIVMGAIHSKSSGATSQTDSIDEIYFRRENLTNISGGTLNASGSVLKLENVSTQTSGTLNDTVDVLNVTQGITTTGALIKMVSGNTTSKAFNFDTNLTTATPPVGLSSYINIAINGVAYRILAQAV